MLLSGQTEMSRRIRGHDWSRTVLGPLERWPQSLRTAVDLMLGARQPTWIGWGPGLTMLYNDACIDALGLAEHPAALGRDVAEVWAEAWAELWQVCGPSVDRVLRHGEAGCVDDVRLFMNRGDGVEESHFAFSYSPIRDESGAVAGLFCPCHDTSAQVIGARRLATLQALAAHALVDQTTEAACGRALAAIAPNADDIPFALLYLHDGEHARLVARAGAVDAALAPPAIALDAHRTPTAPWPVAAALRGELQRLDLAPLRALGELPCGAAGHAVTQALVLPLQLGPTAGALVAGINPTRRLDDDHRSFFVLLASQLGRVIASARAAEQERRRADALVELDRAKTALLANLSHEFRTPLTLLLGPLEDLLDQSAGTQRELLTTARRNAQRLLKLVNTLLNLARIEGGRADACFEPVDLAALSADLASNFRTACERAGLQLIVDCPPLPQPVFVDHDAWEKVVLNLLSNAFKFTFEGAITLSLRPGAEGRAAELEVRDSGSGIAADALPRLFDRFYRVDGAPARSVEGVGIGLALVRELVELHGGRIDAASVEGEGSVFTVRLPFGRAHLPPERVRGAAGCARGPTQAAVFVDEALQWLGPQHAGAAPNSGFGVLDAAPGAAGAERSRILVVDDNADLRGYLQRLLGTRYAVRALADGEAALQAALQDAPDLLLSDVMLPKLDGFGLVAALRADTRTRTLPIILLSARAGEESRLEGLASGADDYVVKPFSARELLARVAAQLATARIRRDAAAAVRDSEQLLRTALGAVNAGAWVWDPVDDMVELSPDLLALFGSGLRATQSSAKWMAFIHPSDRDRAIAQRNAQAACGEDIDLQFRVLHPGGGLRWMSTVGRRLDERRYSGITIDITERKRAELASVEANERLRIALAAAQLGAFELFLVSGEVQSSAQCKANFGLRPDDALPYARLFELIHEDDRALVREAVGQAIETRCDYDAVYRVVWPDGAPHWIRARGRAIYDEHGRAERMVGVTQNISAQKNYERELLDHRAEQSRLLEQLREADRHKDEFLATLAHELRNPLAPIRHALQLLRGGGGERVPLADMHDMLERQTGHMVRLVDDLMELSRISRGAIELRRERVALGAVLRAALETARPAIDEGAHALHLVLPDEVVEVDGDALRLAQVFANLLNNAAKYTDAGGCIELLGGCDGAQAVVTVRDNGIGIAPEQLPRLFRMFGQIDATKARAHGGLGIGLALAQQLVQLHGGSIEAGSPGLGHGSSFTVRLPLLAPGDGVPARAAAAPQPAEAGGQRVLVVDDNRDAADSLALLLQLDGHDVRVVYDGAAALAALDAARPGRPAAVLLDLGMPGMDGLEVARRVRASDAAAATLLIAFTGWGQHTDRERTRAAGFDHHLVKPVAPAALQALLASLDRTAAPAA